MTLVRLLKCRDALPSEKKHTAIVRSKTNRSLNGVSAHIKLPDNNFRYNERQIHSPAAHESTSVFSGLENTKHALLFDE